MLDPGYAWHHIVEQHAYTLGKFDPEVIHNTNNIVLLPAELHNRISGHYSSKSRFSEDGSRVRDWIRQKSFEEQAAYGREVIEKLRRESK